MVWHWIHRFFALCRKNVIESITCQLRTTKYIIFYHENLTVNKIFQFSIVKIQLLLTEDNAMLSRLVQCGEVKAVCWIFNFLEYALVFMKQCQKDWELMLDYSHNCAVCSYALHHQFHKCLWWYVLWNGHLQCYSVAVPFFIFSY